MGLFNPEMCPICSKQTNAFKKTMLRIDKKFVCKDCFQILVRKGINALDMKKYTTEALKNIVNSGNQINSYKTELNKCGKINVNELKVDLSNINNIRKNYISFDVETTGLNSCTDRIVELGAVLFENGIPTKRFDSLVNSNVKISNEASKINNISNEMIQKAPQEKEIFIKFCEFISDVLIGNLTICAHNVSFDMSFLKNTLERLGYSGDINYIDTLSISRKVLNNKVVNHKQDTIAAYFNIINTNSHRAVSDAETCGKILYNLLDLQIELLEKEQKQKEKLNLTDSEKVISAYFQKLIEDSFDDDALFGFRKNASGYIDMCYLYTILRFKNTSNGYYVILPKKIADILKLKKESCSISEGGTENIRVYFNNPKSLEPINDYLIKKYKQSIKDAKSYMSQSEHCKNNAYECKKEMVVFDSNEIVKFNNIINQMELDKEVNESIIKIDFTKIEINPVNTRVPIEEIKNYNNSSKGFDEGFIYWEKGESYRKNKEYEKSIELYDKARANGYDGIVLYDSYSMSYHNLKDYDNEISILNEGIKRFKNKGYNISSLETRRNKAYEQYQKIIEFNNQKKIKEAEKKEKLNEKIENEKRKEENKKTPIEGRHIIQLDDEGNIINEYISISEAVRTTGINSKSIRDAANGIQKHAGSFVWKYKD